jgi:hypothetical protein
MTTTSYNIYQQITSVRLASTINITGDYFNGALNNGVGATLTALTEGALSLDGVLVEVGDRLLLKDQTSANQNGLYVVQSPGSVMGLWMLERAPDFQSLEQLKVGQYFSVGAGNTFEGSMYVLVEPLPSTIGMGTFNFVNVADGAIPSGPYLLKANNFTDVANPAAAFTNLGTGSGQSITITDSDFTGGVYQIPVPFPTQIVCNNLAVSGQSIRLPICNDPFLSPALGQGVTLKMIDCVSTKIDLFDGTTIDNLQGFDQSKYICSDKSSSAGAYTILPEVYFLNSLSGRVELTSNDSSVSITPDASNNTIDLSVSGSGTDLRQLIYVNSLDGNDSNDGSIGSPLQTYDAARLLAISRSASATNPYTLMMVGNFSITGNMILSPFVSITGTYIFNTIFTISGDIVLDSSWNTTLLGSCYVNNCYFNASAMILTFSTWQGSGINAPTIVFDACCLTGVPTVTITGTGTSTTNIFEQIFFMNCPYAPITTLGTPVYHSTNVALLLYNSDNSGGVNSTCTSANSGGVTSIIGTFFQIGNCNFSSSSAGGLTVQLQDLLCVGTTINIDGTNVSLFTDSDSWSFTPTFTGGATIASFNAFSLSDGLKSSSYTPTNYTAVGSSTYPVTSQTAYNRGIDNSLGTKPTKKASGSVTLVGGTATVSSPTVASGDSIVLTCVTAGGTQGIITVSYNPGVSFTLTSSNPLDTSIYKWMNLGA